MYGDFSRDAFDPKKHYTRVLMQQGRPLTDADWNREVTVIADREWQLIRSLLRANHGTFDGGFFPILDVAGNTLKFCSGTYYVDGLRCHLGVTSEPRKLVAGEDPLAVVLDAWEQAISPVSAATLLDPALQGIDTTWATRVEWRLGLVQQKKPNGDSTQLNCECPYAALGITPPHFRTIRVRRRMRSSGDAASPCEIPDNLISTLGESLYRLEVHSRGKPLDLATQDDPGNAMTFKWSRENGASVHSIAPPSGPKLILDKSRYQSASKLVTGDRVELLDQNGHSADADRKLPAVMVSEGEITLSESFGTVPTVESNVITSFPKAIATASMQYHVRRWSQSGDSLTTDDVKGKCRKKIADRADDNKMTLAPSGAAIAVINTQGTSPSKTNDVWLQIDGDFEVQFDDVQYEVGDYWLIRVTDLTSTGFVDIELDPGVTQARVSQPIHRSGGHHLVVFGAINKKGASPVEWFPTIFRPNAKVETVCWNGKLLTDDTTDHAKGCTGIGEGCKGTTPTKPALAPAPPAPAVPTCSIPGPRSLEASAASFLSGEGAKALKGYFASSKDLTRRVPARYLNYEPQSEVYRRFRSPLLVSEILETSFEKYLAKMERCIDVTEAERALVEADARADYALAAEFQSLVSSGQGFRPLIA